jgi:hypothetical protein
MLVVVKPGADFSSGVHGPRRLKSSVPVCWRAIHSVRVFYFGCRTSKFGPNFEAPPLPPCCKACTLTPHPFIYGHLECSQGVGRCDCGRIDIRVCA